MLGHNVLFDRKMMDMLWIRSNSFETFPFGRKMLDTMQIQFFMDLCSNQMQDSYSLKNLNKLYGIKNEKAHTAESDTQATAELFKKQIEKFTKSS
jgi:DNA polymerase III alpha subunit (gram-positive type)